MRITRTHVAVTALVVAVGVGSALVSRNSITSNSSVQTASVRTASNQFGVLQAAAKAHPKKTVTPYVGPFNLHGCGPAITELDRALIRKHFRKAKPAPCYGNPTAREVAAFQRSIHYKATGHYSLVTHQALVRHGGYTFIARGRLIIYAHARYVQSYRNAVVRIEQHVALVGGTTLAYSQSSSRSNFGPGWPAIPAAVDCSAMVIFIEYEAGAGASVGYFGRGSTVGFTGTLAFAGRSIPLGATLYPGDILLYGRFPFFHATIVSRNGLALSHGGRGVQFLPYNYNGQLGSIRRLIG